MKVLVADDELVSRRKMDRLLQGLGYETRVAEGGAEAYRLWRNEQPRVVITDWNWWSMPSWHVKSVLSRSANIIANRRMPSLHFTLNARRGWIA